MWREPHPEDQAWLESERARLAALAERERATLLTALEERLGADVVDAITPRKAVRQEESASLHLHTDALEVQARQQRRRCPPAQEPL